ncbi:ribonuclease T2 family protein [Aquabacter spiritensis]|uniref:Ribonuclease T2 n=1 Tax=Aquabacter spiritensis TaxID=933073 RepID=A0A4R3LRX6_9HYPH|nr:ribonuclease T2 [Aquabacter spiritensis]TCT03180.1 ribonuclease T2 [Aquabacter spiritensis]
MIRGPRAGLFCVLAGLLILLAPAVAQTVAPRDRDRDIPGRFDFYVLSLSWSPTFCAGEAAAGDPQCRAAHPYGFIVHGLWPQYEAGYPAYCQLPPPPVSRAVADGTLDLMPSPGLIRHEWRKHGTCTGLGPVEYFALLRQARARIAIPPPLEAPQADLALSPERIEAAFRAANPGLGADMIAVQCGKGRLSEVRICLTRDLAFRACPEVDRRGCAARRQISVPAPR